ncbi:MAG: lytic transglycosylase domain-containing protein [Alphaproteobacteria bacterium]|nr:lytic transglycosylase domain-containing protein [Alphaproteobacteria bacterium]
MSAIQQIQDGVKTFMADVAEGFFAITHNGLAFIGLVVFCVATLFGTRPDLRASAELRLINWLQDRQNEFISSDAGAVDRITAANPQDLPKQQANLAYWLSRKYKVGAEPISALVAEAYESGDKAMIDPTLILAVMAIESGFNPFAQSPVGAQGLMQVMTKVHIEKYEIFGGKLAAFDPMANLKVGVTVLKDCIARAGSLEGGLKLYVGAVDNSPNNYLNRVLAEHNRLKKVAQGQLVPIAEPSAGSVAAAGLENLWEKAQRLVNPNEEEK